MIEANDRREWAQHAVTQEFMAKMVEYRQNVLEKIGSGEVADDKLQRGIGRAIAAKSFIESIVNLTQEPEERFEEVKEGEDAK